MRNMIKIAVGVLCAGVLLGGIGTGIAIAEYSSLEYTGEHFLGEEKTKTEQFDVSVVPEEGKKILVREYYRAYEIQYKESVPENTIRFVVKYNPDTVSIRTNYEEYKPLTAKELEDGYEQEEVYQGCVRLNYRHRGNEFDLFMKNKDKILEDLKQGKIGSYQVRGGIQSIEILINPQMKDIVEFDF